MEDRIREFDGVTYKDLFLSSIDVVYIRRPARCFMVLSIKFLSARTERM